MLRAVADAERWADRWECARSMLARLVVDR
jgi:hypothetical protein